MTPAWERALVTGASSGIGEAIARRLAAAGTDLVLVARREDRLRSLADELSSARPGGAATDVIVADLGDPASLTEVEERLGADPPIDLLVNNAGFGTSGLFHELPIEREVAEIELNVVALVRLTQAAARAMVARGRGSIMNVSSLASLQALPGSAVYAATKAFVTSFSESVHEDLHGTGVTVTAVLPGFTRTEFQAESGITEEKVGLPDFVWMTADAVAASAIAATARRDPLHVPGLGYKTIAALSGPVPRSLKRWVLGTTRRHS